MHNPLGKLTLECFKVKQHFVLDKVYAFSLFDKVFEISPEVAEWY
jgi:hypothetical protein